MTSTNTLIVGGGQAGLAMSHCLTALGRDHVILERGRVAERWRSERWETLRLLTPNWMTRLPGFSYDGPDPDGFMAATDVVSFFDRYAASFDAPVREQTTVHQLTNRGGTFVATTDDGTVHSDNVVIATGWCDRPWVPAAARHLAARVHQVVPSHYRSPDDLPDGGVLIVGASATGVQLADELRASGRPVTLAVGSHSRVPRTYRGMDVLWWLDMIGAFDKTIEDIGDVAAGRSEPSLQLVGRPDRRSLDLATLQAAGVRLVGRVHRIDGDRVALATDVDRVVDAASARMYRLLDRIDHAIARAGLTDEVLDRDPIPQVRPGDAPHSLDLRTEHISTVVWATGFRRAHHWLGLPILDRHGEIRQHRGVTPLPGAYVLGQRFQHHRNSNFIDGVGRDAQYVAEHIDRTRARSAIRCSPHVSQK